MSFDDNLAAAREAARSAAVTRGAGEADAARRVAAAEAMFPELVRAMQSLADTYRRYQCVPKPQGVPRGYPSLNEIRRLPLGYHVSTGYYFWQFSLEPSGQLLAPKGIDGLRSAIARGSWSNGTYDTDWTEHADEVVGAMIRSAATEIVRLETQGPSEEELKPYPGLRAPRQRGLFRR